MLNLYSTLKQSVGLFRKFEIDPLMFIEFTCADMKEATKVGAWSPNNYFAFVTEGKKIWRSIYNSYEVNRGDILFVKKGANLSHHSFGDEFCAIFIYIPDDFIKAFISRNIPLQSIPQKDISRQDSILRLSNSELLENYRQSIMSYLSLSKKPNNHLLKLKLEELLLSLFSDRKYQDLMDYFISLCQDKNIQIKNVLEKNFAYNLKLEDYAQLCNMSESTFRRYFKRYYNTTPGSWLNNMKLDFAWSKILNSTLNINQIALEAGFEEPSYFIRTFKRKFKTTPYRLRKTYLKNANSSKGLSYLVN